MAEGAESFNELTRLRSIADPERDARIEAYRDQERRKAARALDRYLDAWQDAYAGSGPAPVVAAAGERFVQAVGDYVLSRLSAPNVVTGDDGTRYVMSPDAHKSHYGASDVTCPYDCGHTDCPVHGPEDEARSRTHHNYGASVSGAPVCSHGYQVGVRGQHVANNQPCTDNPDYGATNPDAVMRPGSDHTGHDHPTTEAAVVACEVHRADGSIHPEDGRACRICEGPCAAPSTVVRPESREQD